MPSRSRDSSPAVRPVHDDRRDAGALQQRRCPRRTSREAAPFHRGPAVLHDDHLAVVLRMNGRASSSVRAFADRALTDLRRQIDRPVRSSRRVLPVDAHVLVAQVAAEPRRGRDRRRRERAPRSRLPSSPRAYRRAPTPARSSRRDHAARADADAADRDVERGRIEDHARRARRLQEAPGLGSPPNTAVFTSGESATAFATRRASSSVAAPSTSTIITRVAPSPSAISCRTRRRRRPHRSASELSPANRGRRALRPAPPRSRAAAPCRSSTCTRRP